MCEKETNRRYLSGDVCLICEHAGETEFLRREANKARHPGDDVSDRLLRRYLSTLVRNDEQGHEVLDEEQYRRFVVVHHALTGLLLGQGGSSGRTFLPHLFVKVLTAALNGDVDPDWSLSEAVTIAPGERVLAIVDATLLLPQEQQTKRVSKVIARVINTVGF